jgi:hypothetical protein
MTCQVKIMSSIMELVSNSDSDEEKALGRSDGVLETLAPCFSYPPILILLIADDKEIFRSNRKIPF